MTKEADKLVNNYIEEIKESLPDWITNDEDKLEDIVLEISSHIWDSAYEIAGSEDPDTISVQKAINNLGSPTEIAESYKARGTPKYFISEELWPSYQKAIFSIIAVIFTIIVVVQVVIVEPTNFFQAILNSITLSLNTITIFVIIMTAIFFYLSAEGYFPEDFDTKNKSEQKKFESEYYKPGEFFFSGIGGIVFGLLLITIPKDIIGLFRVLANFVIELINIGTANYSDFTLSGDLQFWMVLNGIVTIVIGITNLMKISNKDPEFHIGMNFFYLLAKIADLGLIVFAWINIGIFLEVLPQFSELLMRILFALGILSTVADIIKTGTKSSKLFDLKNKSSPTSY